MLEVAVVEAVLNQDKGR